MKREHVISVILFIFMFSLFLFYKQAGILQLDLIGMAAYAEYHVFDGYNQAMEKEYAQYNAGKLPWRTANFVLTAITFKILHALGAETAEFSVFLTQFIFGSLAIVFLYLFLYEITNKHWASVIPALFFGLSTPLFNAVLSKDHGTEFFFAFLAMYLLYKGIKNNNCWYFITASTSVGLLVWVREGGVFFPILFYGFFIITVLNKEKKSLVTVKNILSLTIPFAILFYGAYVTYLKTLIFSGIENQTLPLFAKTTEILLSIWQWYPLLFFIFLLIGLYNGVKEKNKATYFFFIIALLSLIVFTKNNTFDIRHLGLYVFFPFSFIIATGIMHIKEWKKISLIILAIILCIDFFMQGIPIYNDRKEHIYTKEFPEAIKVENNALLLMQKDFCLFFMYYGHHSCDSLPEDFTIVDRYLEQEIPVYVPFHLGFGFYDEKTKVAIEETYNLEVVYTGNFETFHHADIKSQVYEEMLLKVTKK